MAQLFQFDDNLQGRRPLCIACEEMLADALDQTLDEADQTWFDQHVASCSDCSQMLADAQRGAAWLEMLKAPRPEPSATLLERIMAQTAGQNVGQTSDQSGDLPSDLSFETTAPLMPHIPGLQPGSMPAEVPSNLLSFPRIQRFASRFASGFGPRAGAGFEPRLAMTAAMAFFSIALTLNLAGVRLDQLRASDLSPSKVKQSYYEASAQAVRYYDNLRVVRVVESRVEQVEDQNLKGRDDDQSATPAQPAAQPTNQQPEDKQKDKKQKDAPKPGGTSRIESPFLRPRFQQVVERRSKSQEGGLV